MAISEKKKNKNPKKPYTPEEEQTIKSEVASFASSLGLASSVPSSGFDDSDFRKTGSIKPAKDQTFDPKSKKKPSKVDRNGELPPKGETFDSGNPKFKKNLKKKKKKKRSPLENVDPFPALDQKGPGRLPLVGPDALSGNWYVDAEELEAKVLGERRDGVAGRGLEELQRVVSEKKELADRLMQQYVKDYHFGRKKNRELQMMENAVKSGTTTDKVSALTCLVEDNPIANMKSLDSLLSMVTTKVGKRYAISCFDGLKELFLFRLLPDRKLKSLLQHPLDRLPESKDGYSLLLFWFWEENLKNRYEQFVAALEEASRDLLPILKDKAVKLIYSLLSGKPEQERRLLASLVNKLGDPVRKSASAAGYHLSCLLSAHPNMKAVVVDEVDSFIFRPHVGQRAKYHAVNFLSQFCFTKTGDGPKLAKRLMEVYFALFKVLLSEPKCGKNEYNNKHGKFFDKRNKKTSKFVKGKPQFQKKTRETPSDSTIEMDSKLLSALLTGVNRAFPYVASDEVDDLIDVQTPILFKLAHSNNFNVGVQALLLLHQITSKNQIASDRFYRALYAKLLAPAAMNSSKPEMFLGLLVKAMKNDINIKRITAFAKRLLQVSLQQPPQFACGCLFMLSEVLKARPPLWNMMVQNESIDDDIEHFEDIIEEPQDIQDTALLNESEPPISSHGNDNTVGGHLSDSEKEKEFKGLSAKEFSNSLTENNLPKAPNQANTVAFALPAGYDPRHREPCYCKAENTGWWELSILAAHTHPSVSTMARTLLSGASIVYNGNPLIDLSLVAFLDKFMEKKPKSNQKGDGAWHGGSEIAPARKLDMNRHLIGEEILQLAEEDVPPEDVIFHKFYMKNSTSGSRHKKKKKKASEDDDDADELPVDDGGDNSDDEEIDNMLGLKALPAEADGDYDYDDLDEVASEDEDELLENDSENEDELLENDRDDEMDSAAEQPEGDDNEDSDISAMGSEGEEEEDDHDDEFEQVNKVDTKKRKSKASPFASFEDYEHLFNDDGKSSEEPKLPKNKKSKSKKNPEEPKLPKSKRSNSKSKKNSY